jgi:hypothetical protein
MGALSGNPRAQVGIFTEGHSTVSGGHAGTGTGILEAIAAYNLGDWTATPFL